MELQDYLTLPYTKLVRRDGEGDFIAKVLELPGCVADGPTEAEALEALAEAQSLWIEDAIAAGHQVPEPVPEDDSLPSGRWLQRVPRSLHRSLVEVARTEGVSLNQFVITVLSEAVGRRSASQPPARHTTHISAGIGTWLASHGDFEPAAARTIQTFILEATPSWTIETDSDVAITYLNSLTGLVPNHGYVGTKELVDVHERSVLPGVHKAPAASLGRAKRINR